MSIALLPCTQNVTAVNSMTFAYYRFYLKFDLSTVSVKSVNSAYVYAYMGGSTSISTISLNLNVLNGNNSWTESSAYGDFNSSGTVGVGGWTATTWSVPAYAGAAWYSALITGDSTQGIVKAYADGNSNITIHADMSTADCTSINVGTSVGNLSSGIASFTTRTGGTFAPYIYLDYTPGHRTVHSGTSGAMLI